MRSITMKLVTCLILFTILHFTESLSILSQSNNEEKEIIFLYKNAGETIRLRSVLNIDRTNHQNLLARSTSKKQIFWIFKRIYFIPTFSNEKFGQVTSSIETSKNEQMISLDLEVESNLKGKYSISGNVNTMEQTKLNYDLIIHNITYADSGLYVCNQWNQKTIYYQIVVSNPVLKPEMNIESTGTIQSKDLISETSNVTVRCISKYAYPYPSIKWFMNNDEIFAPNQDMRISYEFLEMETNKIESTLSIANISSSYHNKNFTCQLIQNNETLTNKASSTYKLNISFKPIITISVKNSDTGMTINSIDLENNSLILFNDSRSVFKSEFLANPIESIKSEWLLDGKIQNSINSDEFDWLKRSNRFSPNAKTMNLTYRVSNAVGSSQLSFIITVAYPPRIIASKKSTTYDINELSPFHVTCKTDASPQATSIKWLYFENKKSMDNKFMIVSNSSVLRIPSVSHSQANGYFICVANNQMRDSFGVSKNGEDMGQRIELNIKFMPTMSVFHKKIAANLTKVTETHQYRQNITCQSRANPAPEFTWYKDSMKLFETSDQSKYTIRTIQHENEEYLYTSILTINTLNVLDLNRNYECEATNSLGSNRAKIELVPMSKPDQPTNLKSTFVNFMTTTLTWEAGFNGGLAQKFIIRLNDTSYSINNSTCSKHDHLICIEKINENSINLHNLKFNTLYKIEISSYNELGFSGSSNSISVRTNDLTKADIHLLPAIDRLYLNVPKNRLEFRIEDKPSIFAHYCLKIKTNLGALNDCFPVSELQSQQHVSLDSATSLDISSVKSMEALVCFQVSENICSSNPIKAMIDSHSNSQEASQSIPIVKSNGQSSIPIALIIGIAVCIVSLLTLLLLTVCYCIRKRNFKLCKSLLTTASLNVSDKNSNSSHRPLSGFSGSITETEKKSTHLNKTFNIDIGSISAPLGTNLTDSSTSSDLNNSAGYGTGGSGLNVVNGSISSSINENLSNNSVKSKTPFVAALSATANNLMNNSIGRTKLNEILVVEDSEQQARSINHTRSLKLKEDEAAKNRHVSLSKSSSSTGVSNCSSLNNNIQNNQQFLYSEFMNSFDQNDGNSTKKDLFEKGVTYIDTFNHNNSSSAGSNSDPIAINNSLSSANSTADNSPTYGYNVTNATTTLQKNECFEDSDNLLYIKTGINQKNFTQQTKSDDQYLLRNKSTGPSSDSSSSGVSCSKHNSFHGNQFDNNTPESGYSTPSRLKKVVYEVIV